MTRRWFLTDRIEHYSIPEPNSGCWLWLAQISPDGYGRIKWKYRHRGAHQMSWLAYKGMIPTGHVVCHKCDVRSCVNPDHLWIGTVADNNADMVRKGRQRNGASPKRTVGLL